MSGLTRAVYATAPTRRRRLMWCVWWTAEPSEQPFRTPDAWGGGARTADEARVLAQRAAGRPVEPIDGRWAGAWNRVRAGLPPFPTRARRRPTTSGVARARPVDPYALLGVAATATLAEVKAAFRARAHEHHPDRGGDAEAFMAIKKAFDGINRRRTRGPRRT